MWGEGTDIADALVVGGGILGTAAAERLAARGKRVILLDGGNEISASERSMGWVNDAAPTLPAYHTLRQLGQQALIHFQRRDPTAWYHPSGTLTWGQRGEHERLNSATVSLNESIDETAERLQQEGQEAAVLVPKAAARIEPALAAERITGSVLWTKNDAWVDLPLLIETLRRRFLYAGGQLMYRRAVSLLRTEYRATGVMTAEGKALYARKIIVAAGAGTIPFLGDAGIHLPDESTTGVLLYTEPTEVELRTVIRTPVGEVRSDSQKRLVIVAPRLDEAADIGQEALWTAAEDILFHLSRLLKKHPRLKVSHFAQGARPIPGGKLPIVGRVPGWKGLSVAFTHSGATVGLLLGQMLAEEILKKSLFEELAPFRPDRFLA